MKLSIAMIVKNEEKYIEATLKSLKKLEKYLTCEIVIVDTGSTDNTIEISKKYTNKIYHHKWTDNFAQMRNISLSYCTGEWILVVDADEVLYEPEKLAQLINDKNTKKYNAGFINIINFNKDIENSVTNESISKLLRLFKNKAIKYEGAVHEQPIFKYPVIDSHIRFIHYGYNNSDFELMEYKFERNIKLLFKELSEKPDSIYINFQIAASYVMHKDIPEALKYIKAAYELSKDEIHKYIYVLDKYCDILYKSKKYTLLVEKTAEALAYEKEFIDYYFYLGEGYYNLNDYTNAVIAYKDYLKYYELINMNSISFNNTISVQTRKFKDAVLLRLASSCLKNKDYKSAIDNIKKVKDKDLLKNEVYIIVSIIAEGKMWSEIDILNELIDKYNYDILLKYLQREVLTEELARLENAASHIYLKEMIYNVRYFKEKGNIDYIIRNRIMEIMNKDKTLYSIYVYYLIKEDIHAINQLVTFGMDKMENILISLCTDYYDFNSSLLKGLKIIKGNDIKETAVRLVIEKALLLCGNLPENLKKEMFLSFIAEKYYFLINSFNSIILEDNEHMLQEEDRYLLNLKYVMEDKYENSLRFIKGLKDLLNINKSYVQYINLLMEDIEETRDNNIKGLIPELIINIDNLIKLQRFQEAYNTLEEALSIVKFDFDLMILKYSLLMNFNYDEEGKECLKNIILFGDRNRVKELLK